MFLFALALAVLHAANLLAAEHAAAAASLDAAARIRRAIFNHASRLGVVATRPQASAEVANLFTEKAGSLEDGFRTWLTSTWRAPVLVVLLSAIILAVNFWLGLSFLLLGGPGLDRGRAGWRRGSAGTAGPRARRAEARRAQMRESLSMLQLVKSYLMERFNQNRVERQLADYARAEWRRVRGDALSAPALSAVALLADRRHALPRRPGGPRRDAVPGRAGTPDGGPRAPSSARSGPGSPGGSGSDEPATRRPTWSSSWTAEADAGLPIDAEFLQPMVRKLDFVDVSYREPGTGRMVLENVTLSIPTGTRVAVVGSDQAEVHTLAFLLTRFLDPTAGEVRIDGKNLRWVTHDSLRTQVALVMQNLLVFNDTVANNIGCGDPGFTLPQIIEAAKVAHAHQFVQKLPYGYETPIGEPGTACGPASSSGSRLARAILRDPSLLVIEEPDGPLDDDTKALLDDTFERLRQGRTQVILVPPAVRPPARRPGVRASQRPARRVGDARRADAGERAVSATSYSRRLPWPGRRRKFDPPYEAETHARSCEVALEAATRAGRFIRHEYESFTPDPERPGEYQHARRSRVAGPDLSIPPRAFPGRRVVRRRGTRFASRIASGIPTGLGDRPDRRHPRVRHEERRVLGHDRADGGPPAGASAWCSSR